MTTIESPPSLEWRYERKCESARAIHDSKRWSQWYKDKALCIAMAAHPDFGTGRIQERERPPRNEITIERINA